MEETNFTKAQIKEMLAQRYWIAFSDYERLALAAKELAGIAAAAEALGISENEFRKAVGCDRERTENDG